jgi:hypothetical protein
MEPRIRSWERPDASGKPAVTGGIHSMGRGLCPSKAAAREFQLGYCRELFDEFYPQADGLFLEHSDYGSCECAACAGGAGLRREWEFVDEISRHVWSRKPEAIEMINPKYATLGVAYDPRYIVFLAPHNATGAELVKKPKNPLARLLGRRWLFPGALPNGCAGRACWSDPVDGELHLRARLGVRHSLGAGGLRGLGRPARPSDAVLFPRVLRAAGARGCRISGGA